MQPITRPSAPHFSSGPCAKRPGWTPEALSDAVLGRSHRSAIGKAKLKAVIDKSKALLGIPEDYRVAIVPASNTGAVEMALWNLLGPRGVDVLAWESFGATWATDIAKHLKLPDVRLLDAPYGNLPDLSATDADRDLVFVWNGTTSGVRLPDGDWIPDDRAGLTICDATSAAFAMDLPWQKLDVVTWSWQKALGGEAAHGMLALSPRAIERLENHVPAWPLPKIFRLTKGGKLIDGVFVGETINTPSMLCVEDALDGLDWAASVGGVSALIGRAEANLAVLTAWVEQTDWVEFLAERREIRSATSVCLSITDTWFAVMAEADKRAVVKEIAGLLEADDIAYDIAGHRDAPPGLRIWAGATVEHADLVALLPWLNWAYGAVKANRQSAA